MVRLGPILVYGMYFVNGLTHNNCSPLLEKCHNGCRTSREIIRFAEKTIFGYYSNMTDNTYKKVCLIPKIAGLLFVAFLALFSLDVISPEYGIGQIMLGLLIHNIPVFILLAVILVAWRYEIVGAVVFVLAGILYISLIVFNVINHQFAWYVVSWSFVIAGPAFVVSYMYFYCWKKKKQGNKQPGG